LDVIAINRLTDLIYFTYIYLTKKLLKDL